jgi:hypothetical protein
MTRSPLPLRRSHEIFNFRHWGRKFIAGIGRASSRDPIQEVWINTGKSGEQMETLARDSAVLISLGLQHGVPLSAMQKAIMRDLDGEPTGPIGKLLDLIADDSSSESAPGIHNAALSGSSLVEHTT